MTKRLKLLLFLFLVTLISTMGCSTYLSYTEYVPGIDTELEYYVDYVKQLSNDFSKVNSVTFYTKIPIGVSKYTIGFCSYSLIYWTHYVKINKYWWSTASERERILLIAHELKHCSCATNWMHIDKEDFAGCRSNYMSSTIPTPYCIKTYWNDYIAQIKRGCNDR